MMQSSLQWERWVFLLRSATNKHMQAQNHRANHTPVTLKLYTIPVFNIHYYLPQFN